MSQRQTIQYGTKTFDLSVDRAQEKDYQLIQAPKARNITVVNAPAECYIHIGTPQSSRIDLRDFEILSVPKGETFGQVYLENPSSVTGTLKLFIGVGIEAEQERNIGDIDDINNVSATVTVDDSGSFKINDVGTTVNTTTDSTDAGPYSDRVTAVNTNATVSPGRFGNPVEIVADTSGSATLTVEVSQDGGSNWDAYTISIGGSEGHKETVYGYADVRASVNQNLNGLAISAKGV